MKTHTHSKWPARTHQNKHLCTRLKHYSLLTCIAIASLAASPSHAATIVNGDFSDDSLMRINSGVRYTEIDAGWTAKNAFDADVNTTDNWQITGGVLEQIGSSGSATRASQLFSSELTGTGWSLNFVTADDSLASVQLFAGVDDGDNTNDIVYSNGDDSVPEADIVTGGWTTLIDESPIAVGAHSFEISEDLSGYDIMVLRFKGGNSTVGVTIDNVAFEQVPEPGSITLLALAGASALVFRRRRRNSV